MNNRPLQIALVNDYEIVLAGIREMLSPHADEVDVVELDANAEVAQSVDIALYDTYGQNAPTITSLRDPLGSAKVDKVVVFTWNHSPALVEAVLAAGADGLLSKTLTAEELVACLKRIAAGETVVSLHAERPNDVAATSRGSSDWPGRTAGLTMREAEMITLITLGLSNAEIASRTYLSPNSVKSYIRSAYRKIGVQRRSQAVAWGIDNHMVPDRTRRAV